MEPLAHTLVGAGLARTRLGKATALAVPTLLIAANLPDIDVLSYIGGTDAGFGFRRGWTHGVVGLVTLPLLLTAVLWAYGALPRQRAVRSRPGMILALAYAGIATHPLLDWLNTYGIRLLMPFERRWFYGDSVFIVDPWLWLILGGALFVARRGGRMGWWGWVVLGGLTSAIVLGAGATPPAAKVAWLAGIAVIVMLKRPGRRWSPEIVAWSGLGLAAVYMAFMVTSACLVRKAILAELPRRGVSVVEELMVGPMPADPFRWDVLAQTPRTYRYGSFSWLPASGLSLRPEVIARPDDSPVVRAALSAPEVRGTVRWMRYPFVEVEKTQQGYRVYVLDARYVRSRTRGFGAAVVDLDGRLRVRDGR